MPTPDFNFQPDADDAAPRLPPRPLPAVPPAYALRVDTTFDFTSGGQIVIVEGETILVERHFTRPAACRLRVYDAPDGEAVVIATDLDEENPGPSVTNAAEDIAAQACLRYGLEPERTTFMEHYDDRFRGVWRGQLVEDKERAFGRENGESFDWVSFPQRRGWDCGSPKWKHASKAAVEALIGCKLA